MRPFLHWLLHRHAALGGITELRLFREHGNSPGCWIGYGHPDKLTELVTRLAAAPTGPRPRLPHGGVPKSGEASLYTLLNPIKPTAPCAKGDHSLKRRDKGATDADVLALSLMLIDIDPLRPPSTNATQAELREAMLVGDNIQAWLQAEFSIQSLRGCSGNGCHLLIPLSPITEALNVAARDGRDFLRLLGQRFNTSTAIVDPATWNPSRLTRIYGSLNIKGENTAERPQRLSSLCLEPMPPDQPLFDRVRPALDTFRRASVTVAVGAPSTKPEPASTSLDRSWQEWRRTALEALDLRLVYGNLLTGRVRSPGWLEARDPESPSGDQNPSAGVADGSGAAERGAFHSFRSSSTLSLFDWLIARHIVSDMKAALKQVSVWSGVPLPIRTRVERPSPPPKPPINSDTFLERLANAWASAADDDERMRLMDSFIEELLNMPPWVKRNLRVELLRMTGIDSRDFTELVRQVKARQKPDSEEATSDTPVIVWVKNRDKVSDLFDLLVGQLIRHQHFFQFGEDLVFVRSQLGPLRLHCENLPGLLTAICELKVHRINYREEEVFSTYDVLPSKLASAFLENPLIKERLPELRAYTRSPLFGVGWRYVGAPGWHPQAGIYYDGPPVPILRSTRLERLQQMLAEFAWAADPDRWNYLGALLTAITLPLWTDGHALLAINGNRPGTGKTTLAQLIAILTEASQVESITWVPEDDELEKRIGSRVEAGAHVVLIDNVKARAPIESAVLERTATAAKPSFRRLGTNTEITRPQNDLLLILTMNATRLGQDLRRRSIPVNLALTEDPTSRKFKVERITSWAQEHRIALVGELAGLITAWLEAGQPWPKDPARHSTSNTWAGTIDAILAFHGLGRFLVGYDDAMNQLDAGYEWMAEVAARVFDFPPAHAADWVIRIEQAGFSDRFKDKFGRERNARSKAILLGSIFNEYAGKLFALEDGRRVKLVQQFPRGTMHKAIYGFQLL